MRYVGAGIRFNIIPEFASYFVHERWTPKSYFSDNKTLFIITIVISSSTVTYNCNFLQINIRNINNYNKCRFNVNKMLLYI